MLASNQSVPEMAIDTWPHKLQSPQRLFLTPQPEKSLNNSSHPRIVLHMRPIFDKWPVY